MEILENGALETVLQKTDRGLIRLPFCFKYYSDSVSLGSLGSLSSSSLALFIRRSAARPYCPLSFVRSGQKSKMVSFWGSSNEQSLRLSTHRLHFHTKKKRKCLNRKKEKRKERRVILLRRQMYL